jgi:hypothetical protein
LAESLTLPQRSEYWPLDERDTVLGFPLTFIPQHRAKADISSLVKADIFILGRQTTSPKAHSPIKVDPPSSKTDLLSVIDDFRLAIWRKGTHCINKK